ncbi:hypothetical protein CRG98_012482 [Punica granatum]|uniref:Uncharacterized protein n=1 Tax=Punica granatum TaxID=22663 RepID=A0A2I0KF66_PUNGR|nr:hypothetical protein CRG98_012482 [Punica granatum]
MTAQAAELASGKAQSFLSSKASFRQPNRGPSPSGTSRLLFCSGVRPFRVRPDYFPAQGSVPFGYVPTTFLHRGPSPSGTSRLLSCSGVRPLRVRPDYFPAQASVPFGYVPTTFLLRGHPLLVRPDYFSAQGSVPFGYVPTTFLLRGHPLQASSPSGTSRVLLCSGVIPFGYVPTTFLHRGHPLRGCPDYFSAQGSVPFGYVPTTFCSRVRPLRVRPDFKFPCTMQPAGQHAPHLANPPGKTPRTPQVHWVGTFEPCCSFGKSPVHIANPSGTSRLLFCSGVRPLRVRPDYFSALRSVPFGYVPTTFLFRGHPLRVRPDYFPAQGSSPSDTSQLLSCSGVIPFRYVPTTFLHRSPSSSGTSRLLFC